ncbi:glycosyltransferase [Yinghuangia seranimata]|uniref:glycosyltransferase n=1 Tax=Yinghuangia seranimata TaxID=408067 RepID=UPI00248B9EA7|nr:glycosyltransferase [Yinghuangia seranimata]MDI2132266.1 glycosyltransferase [Yinghuangia seranimata]
MAGEAAAPRLVLLRMNWITGDSRVQKLALAMAERGWDVVVLGRSRTDAREVTVLGGPGPGAATVIRVPVPALAAPYRRALRQRGVLGRVGFLSRDDEVADRAAVNFKRRELAADQGQATTATARAVHGLKRAGVNAARARHMLRRTATRRHSAHIARVARPGAKARAAVYTWLAEGSGWRATQPQLVDFEAAFGPEIDALRPAVVHAQDITALGVGARAVGRAREAGLPTVLVYDAQEFIPGAGYPDPVQKAAYVGLERELIGRADGVVTVSGTLADLLKARHRLRARPTVATNAPRLARPEGAAPGGGVRGAAGLPDDVPVLVYSGWLAPERGVDTLAEALVSLPEAHAVVVAGDRRPYFDELEARVDELGVAGRFHFVPYVEPEAVVDHLATATVGIIPLRHLPNHEISLITKYYEYMHAGLPIVVSDVKTMAAFTRSLGCGEVFRAGDAAGLAAAVRKVLDDRARYVKPYAEDGLLAEHSWDRQADNVADLYERLTGLRPEPGAGGTLADEPAPDGWFASDEATTVEHADATAVPALGRPPGELTDAANVEAPPARAVVLVGSPAGLDRPGVRSLAAGLRADGLDVVLMAPDPGGPGASTRDPVAAPDAVQLLSVPTPRTVAAGRDRRRGTDETQARAARIYAEFVGHEPPRRRIPALPPLTWPNALPDAVDAEVALTPVLRALAPQTIHACDPVALMIASHAAHTLRSTRVTYHRPAAPPDERRLVRRALKAMERTCLPRADEIRVLDEGTERADGPRGRRARAKSRGDEPPSLVIGPANMAGQGWAWARSVEAALPSARAEVLALRREGPLAFPADRWLSSGGWESASVHLALRRHLVGAATHVLIESGLPLTGRAAGSVAAEARVLREAGLDVGLVFHGSDIRDPRRHRQLYAESPFADPNAQVSQELQPKVDARVADLVGWDGPVFVSTPDLLDFVLDRWPQARWLPVVVDVARFGPGAEPLRRARPVVLHAPSRGALKSSSVVDAVVGELAGRGLVEYRRVEGVPPADMPALVADADVVVDQLAVGNVGVLAAQAMAAGRLVVGHTASAVRARYGTPALPQWEATPRTLRAALAAVLDDRDAARRLAAEGPGFVALHHDGRRSAAVLAQFLAVSSGPPLDSKETSDG